MAAAQSKPWHKLPTDQMGGAVAELVESFKREQEWRRKNYIRNLELYEQRTLGGYYAQSYYAGKDAEEFQPDRLGLIRSAVSSAVANIYAPQKPKPQFQTLGADWATRRKAYKLDRICEGVINQRQGRWINVWSFMIDAGVECSLQGVAAIKVTADQDEKRIQHELVPLPDLFVDPAEGRTPTNLFQRAPIDEGVALKLYPGAKGAIRGAPPYEWYGAARTERPRQSKVIEIQYAWRLPFGGKPGKWCAVIGKEVVDSGEWTAPMFPFVFLTWEPHRDGFWASGIADEGRRLAEQAGELDLRLYHRELVASGNVGFYQRDSVKPDDLSGNDAMRWIPVEPGTTTMPTMQQTVAFSPMELQYLQSKVQAFWDSIGISQVSAAARREQGVESGTAIRTLNDTKAGRQLVKSQRYEQAYVDLAHQYVWRLRELAEEDPDFAVNWKGKTLMRAIKWSEADVEDDLFSVAVAPASALPHDPAGRQEMVQEMYASQLISQETAKSLIGWPDLESELNVENSEYEYVDMLIEKYLDADPKSWSDFDYQAPEGHMLNKMGALRRFSSAWFRARIDQAALPPEEQRAAEFNIGLLRRYIQELVAKMQPPAPPAGAPPVAAMPGGMPGPGAQAAAPMFPPDQLPPRMPMVA